MDILSLASSSAGNCYRISDGKTALLLEAGIPMQKIKQGLNYKLSGIDGCLISHSHTDHCKAVKDLLKAGIDVYATEETLEVIGVLGDHRINVVSVHKQFTINTFVIKAFETQHDCPGSVGYLIYSTTTHEKLVFITDSYYVRYVFSGLTHVMVECNYAADILQANVSNGSLPEAQRARLVKSHFSLEHVKQFLKANDLRKVQEIYLLHLSAGNSDAERFKKEIQAVTGKRVIVCKE
jgi:phosphoribosyl 1,2-cyclic phosphodiesterase